MKVDRETGAVTLGKNDVRLGNFVVSESKKGFTVRPISGVVEFVFSRESLMGQCMPLMLEEKNRRFCGAWIMALFLIATVAPDVRFVTDLLDAGQAAVRRHPEMHGGANKLSKRDDGKALKEEREFRETLDGIAGRQTG